MTAIAESKSIRQTDKPYPDFPLFLHASGQWAKKIHGKMHYFGSDAIAALVKFQAERDDLFAGRTPQSRTAATTMADLCNSFLSSKKLLMDAGELSPRTWRDYYETCNRLYALVGKTVVVKNLGALDFDQLRAKLAADRGPVALGNEIQRIRSVFKFAFDVGLVEIPTRFGQSFKRPSQRSIRRAKHAAGQRLIEADDLRSLIAAARLPLRAMILLGVNCGFGQTDVATLPLLSIDLKKGWVEFPRPKTEIPRRCKLWPETIAAVKAAIAKRPKPHSAADCGLVFITKYGHRFVRSNRHEDRTAVQIDGVQQVFSKLLRDCKVNRPGIGFYALRHTFRTIADRSGDQPACDYIMGHNDGHISARYRERIDDDRLVKITDLVRAWLWPKKEKEKGKKGTGKKKPARGR